MAKNPVIIEASRGEDFSPVKNVEGVDSPQSSADDQVRMFTNWLKAAGLEIETDPTGLPPYKFEISPHFAVDRADFLAQWTALEQKPTISEGTVIGCNDI
jgi:UDP-N-acetylglucosamine/UDP-N-acetylgalactosamine diphosphorylase